MFSLDDYYIGLIFPSSEYFHNPKASRYLGDVNFDPFQEVSKEEAQIWGVPVLLRKNGEQYHDEEWSLWKNELKYQLGEVNSLGILLAHIKPFRECYHEKPTTYLLEEVEDDEEAMLEMITHSYYVVYSKTEREYAVIPTQTEPMDSVRHEYFRNLLGEEAFESLWNHKVFQMKK